MKIIDFKREGNLVRFYLGDNRLRRYFGKRWDIVPYEHNAGPVAKEYIKGYRDICFPFDSLVLEPSDGAFSSNSCYSKMDMVEEKVPCIIVVPVELHQSSRHKDFAYFAGCSEKVTKYYFNQIMEPDGNAAMKNTMSASAISKSLMSLMKYVPEGDMNADAYYQAVAYATKCLYEIEHIKTNL